MTTDVHEDGAEGGANASVPLPNALNTHSLETPVCAQVEMPSADMETYAVVEQDDSKGMGEGDGHLNADLSQR